MPSRFQPGDHLQVRRPLLYNHHGIYVNNDRVIQFGGGIWDKPHAKIEAVSLKDFERDGTAQVVQHGRRTWFSGYLFEPDEPWKIVDRAEFLLKLQPKLPYNLIGHNCEHIANMCVTGGYTESHQTRTFFGVRALGNWALMLYMAGLTRSKRPMPKRLAPFLAASTIASVVTVSTYHYQIKLFWDEIREDWRAHERLLSEDPRNGLPG